MNRIAHALLVASLAAALPCLAAAAEGPEAGARQPRCRGGDPAKLPDQPGFDEKQFLSTFKPCRFGEEPDVQAENGLMWMEVPVPALSPPPGDPAIFFPGMSGGAAQVWFGGRPIFEVGVIVPGGWVKPAYQEGQLVRIPSQALGGSVLVRVQSTLGLKVDPPRFGERADLLAKLAEKAVVSVPVGFVAALIGLVFLLFSAARRTRQFLGFGGLSLATGLYILFEEDFLAALFHSPRSMYFAVLLAAYLIPPSIIDFVNQTIGTRKRPWLEKLYAVSVGVTALCMLLTVAGLPMIWIIAPWALFAFGSASAAVWTSVVEVRAGNREARYFVVGMGIFLGCLGLELVSALTAGRNGGAVVLGAAASITANMLILVRRYVLLAKKSQDQAERLGAREADVRKFAEDLAGWAQRLGEAVQGLRKAAELQAEALRHQGQALVEAQATTSEIGQASSVAKARADAVLGGAARAEAAGKASDEAINQTFSGLDAVKAAVGATAHQAASLGAESEELVGVVTAVKDLAAQSRLMALNAGLEAARAGELGRGFGVVAGELRRLAEASASSADKVAKALRNIHGAVTETVRLADGGAREVETVVDRIRASGQQLREVATIAASAGAEAREIATAVGQQDTGVHEVLEALRVLDAQAAGTGKALEEADKASARVQEVVAGLLAAAEKARSQL